MEDLERKFDVAMREIYVRAKTEVGYNATRFLQMLDEHGGLETAKILLKGQHVSDGYFALIDRGRLDLTVEHLVLEEKWHPLFSEEEREKARTRLGLSV